MSDEKVSKKKTGSHNSNGPEKAITTVHEGKDISIIMDAAGTGRRRSLAGFDEDYIDIVDYIIRCTHKIWEEKGIGLIYSHYNHNAIIHTTDGITYGRDQVIEDTIKSMAAFPDARLYGDDVIWSGNDKDGFHTSHRITWVGHNTGHSVYGPPTGRKVVRTGIAHCLVKENKIVEEWLVRDELALIRQLGLDEFALARKFAAAAAARGQPTTPPSYGDLDRLEGQLPPKPVEPKPRDMHEAEYLVRSAIQEIWNTRLLNRLPEYYVPTYHARVSTAKNLYGLMDFRAYVLGIMAAFPDLAITVHHVTINGSAEEGYRVATRWLLDGTHKGPGPYGSPTGRRVRMWGITHQDVKDGKFTREWTVFDEFALLKQICAPKAGAASPAAEETG